MACNSCTKPFSLLRKEKGCPGCGFSYCSKCLNNKVFIKKHNSEVKLIETVIPWHSSKLHEPPSLPLGPNKVCPKCARCPNQNETYKIEPPDTFYKRMADTKTYSEMDAGPSQASKGSSETEQQIQERLQKLKGDKIGSKKIDTNDEIESRLQKVKGEMPSTSDAELYDRLAKLKGVPVNLVQPSKTPIIVLTDQRTEQEQADDLLKQYTAQAMIDVKYKDEFDEILDNIENRLTKLKGSSCGNDKPQQISESDYEEESVNKIIEKVKAESLIDNEDNITPSTNDELPFCEICNEDARMRCLGCQYLFCKRCFLEHKDDDDACDKYEVYAPPNHQTNI